MKNKLLKIGLLGFILLSTILFTNKVEAKSCKIYKDYYYFLDGTTREWYEKVSPLANGENFEQPNSTYVPAGYAANSVLKSQGQIKIVRDNATGEEWSLKDYYDKYKIIIEKDGTTISTPEGEDEVKIYTEPTTEEAEIDVIRHILHGTWYKEGNEYRYGVAEDYKEESKENLIASSMIPTETTITFDYNEDKEIFEVEVNRNIFKADLDAVTGGATATLGGEKRTDVINAPGLYYIVYNYCTYTGTINYYYEGTEKRVEFDDNSANPYIKSGLEAGAEEKVQSPELKNCTPDIENVTIKIDKENPQDVSYDVYYTCDSYKAQIDYVYAETGEEAADSYFEANLEDGYTKNVESPKVEGCVTKDKEVKVNIEGKDFYKKVEYVCEIPDNGPTGSFLIYIAWMVGLGALGYSVYYFIKLKKKTNK